ncbi:MAG: hypothetical protein ACQERC_03490 [Bacteroidota bacterium]
MRLTISIALILVFSNFAWNQQDTITTVNKESAITGKISRGYIHPCQFTAFLNEKNRFQFPALNGSVLPSVQYCYPQIGISLYSKNTTHYNSEVNIFPTVNVLGSQAFEDNVQSFRGTVGAGITVQLNNKWRGRAIFNVGAVSNALDADPFNSILQNSFYRSNDTATAMVFQPRARISYRPSDFFEVQTGIDHQFIGEGNRSMLLSDFGAPRPFVKLRTRFWKIEFTNIYQLLNERVGGQRRNKFSATHTLDFHLNQNFKIGLFESVIFAPEDTLMNRGFEVEYLNPFLFYRPTEYSIGSQDRLLIGLNTSYQFRNLMIYGQLVIDEFVLDELVNRTRWWANKYGGQLGVKSETRLDEHKIRWLTELNFARPFTYSHLDQSTVYGNQGIPLAHPMGANFVESFSEARYFINPRLSIGATFMFAQQGGLDANSSVGYGADIYRPYTEKPFEYGYRIGGNGKLNRLRGTLELNYELSYKMRLNAFIRPGVEVRSFDGQPNITQPFIFGGIRTQLWNERSFSY